MFWPYSWQVFQLYACQWFTQDWHIPATLPWFIFLCVQCVLQASIEVHLYFWLFVCVSSHIQWIKQTGLCCPKQSPLAKLPARLHMALIRHRDVFRIRLGWDSCLGLPIWVKEVETVLSLRGICQGKITQISPMKLSAWGDDDGGISVNSTHILIWITLAGQ